jgi:ubiquinone/menaquinone biosynthesis C-methylase UbiE
MTEALEDEFDVVAAWTEQAVDELGPGCAIAAGCRGSGSPTGLAWLAEALEVQVARRMLDAGSGVGGPAAWLATHFGVTPVCAEPMRGAVRASRRLFGLPAIAAAGQALPFPDGAFDAAWCLGVLDTAGDKAAMLAELRRVLGPSGRLGLLAFVATGPLPPPLPEGNDFSTDAELRQLLCGAGFQVLQTVPAGSLADAPASWRAHAERVEDLLARRHAGDPRWETAQEQTARVARLLSGGHLSSTLLHAVAV